jgi:hypothetical protein
LSLLPIREASQVKGIFGPADRLAKVDGRAKTPPWLVVLALADFIPAESIFKPYLVPE